MLGALCLALGLVACDGPGAADAGPPDGGPPDAGPLDAGPPDAGSCDGVPFDWGRGGAQMLPGSDCLDCHTSGGDANTELSVAGTVFEARGCRRGVEGAIVRVTDADGTMLVLTSDEVGNFFSAEPLAAPLTISVEVDGVSRDMISQPAHGSCGRCHTGESAFGLVSVEP